MNEWVKTAAFAGVALAAVAVASMVAPDSYKAEIFSDQGEAFFPGFTDVTAVKAIEVVDYDEAEATARPLKVEFRKNRWLLTSHNDYPAEVRDRLTRTATALVDLKRDQAVSDRVEDHATYGVLDPLDQKSASLTGRGKRLTLRDAAGGALAELVMGKPVEGKEGYRYARLPGDKRVYAVKTDADPSAAFADWVESDLLRVSVTDIARMTLNSYQIDEQMGRVANLQRIAMTPNGENWDAKARTIASTLASLRVVGARPKPKALADQLRTGKLMMTLEAMMSLRERGFFLTPFGQLLSNEGELIVETKAGVLYTLRFGEVVSDSTSAKPSENRYLFITTATRNPEAEARVRSLDAKFADWYYVISGADFSKLHPVKPQEPRREPELPREFEVPPPDRRPAPPQAP